MYTDACKKCRSCSYFFCVYFLDNMGLYIRNYAAKCNKKLPRIYNMALPEKNSRPIGRGVPNYRCSGLVAMLFQQLVNRMCSPGPSRGTRFRGGVYLNLPESIKSSKFT